VMAYASTTGRGSLRRRSGAGIAHHGFVMRSMAKNGQKHARIAISTSIHVHIGPASAPTENLVQSRELPRFASGSRHEGFATTVRRTQADPPRSPPPAAPPAMNPVAHAHWKLKPPMRPSTSRISPAR